MTKKTPPISKSIDNCTFIYSFYISSRRLLYKEVRKYLNTSEDIEDIMQDIIVKLIENLDVLQSLSPGRQISYAVTIARNLSINLLIRQKRITTDSLETVSPYVAHSTDLEAQAINSDELQLFRMAWTKIPTDIRILLERKYIFQQTDKEIALDLGIRPESVRMRLTRAKRSAAKILLIHGVFN